MKKLALGILVLLGLGLSYMGVAYADDGSGAGSVATAIDAGSGSAVAPAPAAPSVDALHNPAQAPLAAFDDLKAAKKLGWAMALFAALVMLLKAVAYVKDKLGGVPLLGKLAAWLAVNKRAVWIAGLGAGCAAAYNALAEGGTWMAALMLVAAKVFALMSPTTEPAKG
jgi:hypothetical protein